MSVNLTAEAQAYLRRHAGAGDLVAGHLTLWVGAVWKRLFSDPINPKVCSNQMTTPMMTMMRMICLIVRSIGMRSIRYSTRPMTTSVTMMPMIPDVNVRTLLLPLDAGKSSCCVNYCGWLEIPRF